MPVADEHAARCEHDDDTRDRRRGLDDARRHRADEKEKEGIFDDFKRLFDGTHHHFMSFRVHRARHDGEADEHETDARQRIADELDVLALGEHLHEHADDGEEEQERRNVQAPERSDPRRDGGTDVGAHDDGGRLEER